jgi:prepilin-type N-terminal cleavage/methylation domain-containing protein/prepilin-type processing-associated H-X9-DG protein
MPLSPSPIRQPSASGGFTLIELLTVIAVIAVLAALIFTGVQSARGKVNQVKTISNLGNLQKANMLYAGDHNGNFMAVYFNNEEGKVGNPWYKQPLLAEYLGLQMNESGIIWTKDTLCPRAELAMQKIKDGQPEEAITLSYGYNIEGEGIIWNKPAATNERRALRLKEPSKVFAFVTALDWMVKGHGTSAYTGKEERVRNHMTAYRYNNGAAVVYFDGHVEWLPRDQVEVVDKLPAENYRRWNLELEE